MDPGPRRLLAHLRRHNRYVFFLSILTFLSAALLWAALYFLTKWLVILGGSAARPTDWQPPPHPLLDAFISLAVLLCLIAGIDRWLRPNRAVRDAKGFAEKFFDLLLVPPRITLFVAGTAAAWVRLNEAELVQAWNLLRRMRQAGTPMPVQEVPQEIPSEPVREKILRALQLSEVIEMRRSNSGPVVAFCNERARRLASDRVSMRV